MTTTITILNAKQIQSLYGFTRDETYALLNTKGCPVLPRQHKQSPYKVIPDEFEKGLRSRRVES